MGFSFRRSVKMGPLRFNFSTRGVGISAGVRGARVSVGPRGTYVTLGRGGFQYRAKLDGKGHGARSPSPLLDAPPPQVDDGSQGDIATASVERLAAVSPDQTLAEVQYRISRFDWFRAYAIAGAVLLLWVVAVSPLGAFLPLTFLMVLGGAAIYAWNRERRTARLLYDVDDPAIAERLSMASAAGEWLSRCHCLWHVYHSVGTTDWKHNAGATGLIRRTRIQCVEGSLSGIELNIAPWCVPVGPQRLLFLPDRLLVLQGSQLAGIPYEELSATFTPERFIETGGIPADAPVVDRTWTFVNKSGGPDRRFANNRELPVLGYGLLELRSRTGLNVVLQGSNPASPEGAARALTAMVGQASHARSSEPVPAVPIPVLPLPTVPDDQPFELALESRARCAAVILRYIASADRRISDDEVDFASRALRDLCEGHDEIADRVIRDFRKMMSDDATTADAVEALRRGGGAGILTRVVELAKRMAEADGRVTPKERERLALLRQLSAV